MPFEFCVHFSGLHNSNEHAYLPRPKSLTSTIKKISTSPATFQATLPMLMKRLIDPPLGEAKSTEVLRLSFDSIVVETDVADVATSQH
jgi:hypothetical protein